MEKFGFKIQTRTGTTVDRLVVHAVDQAAAAEPPRRGRPPTAPAAPPAATALVSPPPSLRRGPGRPRRPPPTGRLPGVEFVLLPEVIPQPAATTSGRPRRATRPPARFSVASLRLPSWGGALWRPV